MLDLASRFRGWLVVFLIGLVVLGTSSGQAGPSEVGSSRIEIVIVYQNDFHGKLHPSKGDGEERGGLARLAGLVDRWRADYPGSVLWLDGGDTWHGTNLANFFEGQAVVEAFNLAGLDAMVLGNHDFNYGLDGLAERVEQAAFPVISANIVPEDGGQRLVAPSHLFEVGGLQVAVFGLTTPSTPLSTLPSNVTGLTFSGPVEVAAHIVPALREQADLVVALTHLGLPADLELASEVAGIDVIVGGHSHTVLEEPIQVGDTLIVQAGEYGQHLGVLQLAVEEGRVVDYAGWLEPVTSEAPTHSTVAAAIQRWDEPLYDRINEKVAYIDEHLPGDYELMRTQETRLGNLLTDIAREVAGADLALLNGGSIRAPLEAGDVTRGDLTTILPFDNTLVALRVSGQQIKEALEHSLAPYPLPWGGFLQVSGLHLTFDPAAPAGARVRDIVVAGEPLVLDRDYTVATNSFIALGGDGYGMWE